MYGYATPIRPSCFNAYSSLFNARSWTLLMLFYGCSNNLKNNFVSQAEISFPPLFTKIQNNRVPRVYAKSEAAMLHVVGPFPEPSTFKCHK